MECFLFNYDAYLAGSRFGNVLKNSATDRFSQKMYRLSQIKHKQAILFYNKLIKQKAFWMKENEKGGNEKCFSYLLMY